MDGAFQERPRNLEGISALAITLIYVISGGLWILFSDVLLSTLVFNSDSLTKHQTLKGWFYVLATGLMLYVLIKRSTTAVRTANAALRRNEKDLQTILNTIPALVFVTDSNERLLRFNIDVELLELRDRWPALDEWEKYYVTRVLIHTKGNRQAAARVLRVDRKTIDRMIKRHVIDLPVL